MRAHFVGQPFSDNRSLWDFLEGMLGDPPESLTVVAAWAKRSGLERARDLLDALGGEMRSRAIVGVDQGGATVEGLRLCIELFDEAYVFHEPGGGTFHPKLYVARWHDRAAVLVGSGNLTAGGLYANYEAATVVHISDPDTESEDGEFLREVEQYVDRLLAEEELCLPLTGALVERLLGMPWLQVGSEERWRDQGSRSDREPGPFGRRRSGRRTDPAPRRAGDDSSSGAVPPPSEGGAVTPPSDREPTSGRAVVRRWFKRLRAADAQQNAGNNTGNLRLVQANHPIDQLSYFRTEFFDGVAWTAGTDGRGNPKETADVTAEVVAPDISGEHAFRVVHAPHRESAQRNHATVLHWDDLSGFMRGRDFTGWWVVLERTADGQHRLTLQEEEPADGFLR